MSYLFIWNISYTTFNFSPLCLKAGSYRRYHHKNYRATRAVIWLQRADSGRLRRDLSRPAVAYLLVTRDCNFTVQISLAQIDSNVNPCFDILWWMGSDCSRQNAERTWIVCSDGFPPRSTKKQKRKRSVKKTFNYIPCEQSFFSCIAFSVYEVVRVACLSCSWLDGQVKRTTS